MNINIPFRDDMKALILAGQKICTSRNKRYGTIGDQFEIEGHTFVLTCVTSANLDYVAHDRYKQEGFKSPDEFIQIWKEIHPRKGYDQYQSVWLHEFKKV